MMIASKPIKTSSERLIDMKPTRKRSESYLGIHFDFHVRPDTHPMGTKPRPDIFAKMLDAVDPDFMQCDTKGHPGYSTYPTKAGIPAPDMQVDVLKMLRELTRERGIESYRVVSNIGAQAGQSVGHLHFHVLSGRDMTWPPG